jgi:feruloyl esterase
MRVENAILAQYDGADGAVDGLIWDPAVIKLDRKRLDFLSDAQFGALEMIQAGIDEGGDAYYPGFWMSNPSAFTNFLFGMKQPPWGPGDMAPAVPSGWVVADTGSKAIRKDPNFSLITDFDFTSADQLRADRKLNVANGREEFSPAHLKGLKDTGSKLILWTGSADQAVPPKNILDYTKGADEIYGAAERQKFIRTFFVPGMFHCIGGTNHPTDVVDVFLEAAAAWVESGKVPESVTASNRVGDDVFPAMVGSANNPELRKQLMAQGLEADARTYLLCPWPQRSVFKGGVDNKGKLDINDAANWRCAD